MKLLIYAPGLLLVLAAAAFYLGWGRRGLWTRVSGWSELSEAELAWERESRAAFEQEGNRPDLQWAGHASVQIEWGGVRLLGDPVVAGRIQVVPRLFSTPCLDTSLACDAILITHAHMDHLDNGSLAQLPPSRLILPAGSERFLSAAVRARHAVTPIRLGEPTVIGEVEIVPVEARHGGWRYPWQRGLFACGYVIRHGTQTLYLAGDTAQGPHFQAIREAYAPRFAVLPIGAYAPEWFLRIRHLNPEEALDAAAALGAEYVLPYHFGTYRLSAEPMGEPLRRFAAEALLRRRPWLLPFLGGATSPVPLK